MPYPVIKLPLLGIASMIALCACGEQPEGGGPASAGKAAAQAPPPAASTPPPGPSIVHVVKEGETLWDIARSYNVSVDLILAASGLDKRKVRRLSKGTQLRIPGATSVIDVLAQKEQAAKAELPPITDGAYHRLQRGESLWTIARTYDVPIEKLMERNGLTDESLANLRIGQAVVVPGIRPHQVKHSDAKPQHRGFMHEVTRGETVWDIAHAFGVGVGEIMAANTMTAEEVSNIRDGTRLFIPGVEDDGRGRIRRRLSGRERKAQLVAQRLGLGSVRAAGALLHGRIEERWSRAASQAGRFTGTLKWPVSNGWFVRGYGSGRGGYHKAMDIMGKIGWNVRAAAPGIVGYAGDEVSGFGNMVMVVHAGGYVTLYAHNSANFVVAGEQVQRGSILAEVGSTGRSQGPHVHFELIHANQNCDPGPLLRPGVRHRSGKLSRIDYVKWRVPNRRPKQVRCARRQKHPPSQSVMLENPERDAIPESQQGPTMDAQEAPADEEESLELAPKSAPVPDRGTGRRESGKPR